MKIKLIGNVMNYEIDAFGTLVIAVFFLFIGRYLVSKIILVVIKRCILRTVNNIYK